MQRLYVLYDERCGLCRRARLWVEDQDQFVPLEFVAAGSDRARALFPGLTHSEVPEELVVVSDAGEVYREGGAWVMVLYALRDYREWSLRLGSPTLLPLARRAFRLLSTHRGTLSRWLGLSDDDVRGELAHEPDPPCEISSPAPGLQETDRKSGVRRFRDPWTRAFAD